MNVPPRSVNRRTLAKMQLPVGQLVIITEIFTHFLFGIIGILNFDLESLTGLTVWTKHPFPFKTT